MSMRKWMSLVLICLCVTAAACGGSESDGPDRSGDDAAGSSFDEPFTDVEAYPAVVSSELVVGTNRVLIALFDKNDAAIGSPAIDMHAAFFDLEKSTSKPVSEADGRFVWSIKGERGLWEFEGVEFESPGRWGARVSVEGEGLDEDALDTAFEVAREPTTPALGAPAPASDTPTASDVDDLSEITSDDDPDPRFYETSVADAIAGHEPFVVVFASPRYCTSQVCGPTLDVVKRIAKKWRGISFIHVEAYDLSNVSELNAVPAMAQWRLPSEPWVFVVDSRGLVTAKYEGTVSPSGLDADVAELH